MAKAKNSIVVDAPIKKVWEIFDNIEKIPDWMPLLNEVSDLQGEGVGRTYSWRYKFMGMPFKGKSTVTEEVPNKKMVTKSEGGVNSTWNWDLSSEGKGTKIDVEVEYTVPVPVLGRFAEGYVSKQGSRDLGHALDNLKHMVEEK